MLPATVFCALALSFFAQAQTIQIQDDWVFPSGANLSTTLNIGDADSISWDSNLHTWFSEYAPAVTDLTNVSLDLRFQSEQIPSTDWM